MDRSALLRTLCNTNGFGLEIGPSYNPVVPKSEGYRVEIVDYIDQSGLREKYKATKNVDINKIEAVDYSTNGRSLTDTIPHRRRYDYIIASHVVEHTPDFIDFLCGCEALLKATGVLVLAVPDKR